MALCVPIAKGLWSTVDGLEELTGWTEGHLVDVAVVPKGFLYC